MEIHNQQSGEAAKKEFKPPVIPKALKHFFFETFKRRKEFKKIQSEWGAITTVSIIITPVKSIMRVTCGDKKQDEPFTGDELSKFLKMLKVDPKKVEDSKSIFVIMNFENKMISFQQIKKDGEEIKFNL